MKKIYWSCLFFIGCGAAGDDLPRWFDLHADVVFTAIEKCPAGTFTGAAQLMGLRTVDGYPVGAVGVLFQRSPEGYLVPLPDATAHPIALGMSHNIAGTAEHPAPASPVPAAIWTRGEPGTIMNLPGSRIRIEEW